MQASIIAKIPRYPTINCQRAADLFFVFMASSNRYFQSRNLLFVFNIIAYIVPGEIMPLGGYRGFLKCRFAAKFIARATLKGRKWTALGAWFELNRPLKCSLGKTTYCQT
jgi:hypothetical protein